MARKLTRLSQQELNQTFLSALKGAVKTHSGIDSKPLEIDLESGYFQHLRVYIYNATYPPGGRTLGERKIQLMVPGQSRSDRGNFDYSDGRMVLLVGYEADVDVFILWDAGTYRNFPFSMNVQAHPSTIFSAFAGNIATQIRHRRAPTLVEEILICSTSERLLEAIQMRSECTIKRMLAS